MRRRLILFGSRGGWRSAIATAVLTLSVAAMAGAAPTLAVDKTWVQFTPRPDLVPPGGFRMEIGGHAYLVTANHSGVTTLDLSTPMDVVIRRQSDCNILPGGRFTLTPGTMTGVDINPDGSVRLTDYTGSDIDAGPALDPGAPPCGSLPPTDAFGPESVSAPTDVADDLVLRSDLGSGGPQFLILGSAIGIALVFQSRRLRSQPRTGANRCDR